MSRTLGEVRAELNAALARKQSLEEDITQLRDRATEQNRSLTDGEQTRIERLETGVERSAEQVAAFEDESRAIIGEIARNPANREEISDRAADYYADASGERLVGRFASRSQVEGAALRALDRHKDVLTAVAADRLDGVIRDADDDPYGLGARYISAVASAPYRRAFVEILRDPMTAHLRMSREELESVRAVHEADSMRAMSLTGASGGFAVPFTLDPTLLGTSNGAVNPFRQVARVVTIAVDEWRGTTSGAITASYSAEATETTDNSPTLAQPTISTEKAQAFVPFSIELGQDWSSIQDELGGLLAEAKDELEATKFTTGTGTNEPFGVLTGTTNTVNAATGQTFTIDNTYSLKNALPPRYQPRATFMASATIVDAAYRFAGTGSNEPPVVSEDRTRLLGRPLVENTAMPTVTTTGTKFLLVGDFSRFVIVDRIGLSVELIPHLFGTNHRPTGQRGLYMYFRNSSKVIDANAFRVLLGVA